MIAQCRRPSAGQFSRNHCPIRFQALILSVYYLEKYLLHNSVLPPCKLNNNAVTCCYVLFSNSNPHQYYVLGSDNSWLWRDERLWRDEWLSVARACRRHDIDDKFQSSIRWLISIQLTHGTWPVSRSRELSARISSLERGKHLRPGTPVAS